MAKKAKGISAGTNSNDPQQGPRLVCLEIDQIRLYERNPRTVRNPEYERIKQSIASQGLEQPLIVTRRPGDETHMVKSGGNTRLQILKELYAVTGDPCYGIANCIEVGWDDESSVLLGHLRENSLRGDLTFADQAVAIWAYGEMLAEEAGLPYVTIKELQAGLREHGMPISEGTLSRMRYASKVLVPAMPMALADGLGQRPIGGISKLHRTASQFWVRRGIGSADEFDAVFAELCRRYDGPDWQLEPLQRAVENEIAEAAEISVQNVRMAMDQAKFAALPSPDHSDFSELLNAGALSSVGQHEIAAGTDETSRGVANSEKPCSLTLSVGLDEDSGGTGDRDDELDDGSFIELRQRAYQLANALACSFKLDELVIPVPDCGNGFLLADLPDGTAMDRLDTASSAMIGTLWWQLMAFSETACAPPSVIRDRLPAGSALREVLESDNIELLFDRVAIIHAAHFADQFWSRLPKKEWQDWLYLVHTHREIRKKTIELERPLWPGDE